MRPANPARARIRSLVALVALGLVIGCGSPSPSVDGSAASSPAGSGAVSGELELRYTCGTFAFDPAFLNREGNAEAGADPIAGALRAHLARPGLDFDWLPDTGWVLVGSDDHRAELVTRDPAGSLMNVFLENGPTGWTVTGWGGCEPSLVLPPGLNRANWRPDLEAGLPDARTVRLKILVTERECASGQSSEGRIVGPVLLFDADRVLVAFGARRLPGDFQNCQGNPPTPMLLDLGQALGDRLLIDAGHLPFVDVREVDPDF